jgi:uncharacterized protein (DUF983 family)
MRRERDERIAVVCPRCGGQLAIARGCLEVRVLCRACTTDFSLAELARLLDRAAFELLAAAVADRPSDRV